MNKELKEIYQGKKFILIEGEKKEKLEFIKGKEASYRENDIYIYEENENIELILNKINQQLIGSKMKAISFTVDEMIEKNQKLLQEYTDRKKLKDAYGDKKFMFISNGTRDLEEVQGKDLFYKNNTIYVYEENTKLDYLSSKINKELSSMNSKMKVEILNFQQMRKRKTDDLLMDMLESKKNVKKENKNDDKVKNKSYKM